MGHGIRHNVSEIKRLCQERKEASNAVLHFLISKGLSLALAEMIMHDAAGSSKEFTYLKAALAKRICVAGDLAFDKPHRVVFVGPTGVGKTTTILKLAEYYLNEKRKVALATLDETKKEVLKGWAETKKIPFVEEAELETTLYDLYLIDTEGCNYYLPNRIEALGEKIAGLSEGLEVILTLSAAAKEVDLYGAVHQFSPLCPASLCFTKLDETLASGTLLNVALKTTIPIRYIAFGYPLPGDVQVAEPKSITHKILTDFNQEEFQYIRQLST